MTLDDGDVPGPGSHVEHANVEEVVYLGMVTRYGLRLDDGSRLVAVRQNLETAAADVLEAQGSRVRISWRPEQAHRITTPPPVSTEADTEENP